ncbi:hypothetical protein ANN_23608 [Periplaneta americana]|uniref:Uncharacterized protein n=1 Tax=Periplaneta americana TaxID=6978 RepID=A0ABQ8SMR9_PERAM|nr:hypothetical protein ANN_23608 [Periplaneta americana]
MLFLSLSSHTMTEISLSNAKLVSIVNSSDSEEFFFQNLKIMTLASCWCYSISWGVNKKFVGSENEQKHFAGNYVT